MSAYVWISFHLNPSICPISEQNRPTYSRSHYKESENPDEMQEIFQRTMRSRLESFKSAKMGVNPAKKISKHPKKDSTHKVLDFNVLLSAFG